MQSKKSGCLLLGFRFPSRGEVLFQLNLGELQELIRLTTDCVSWRASETMPWPKLFNLGPDLKHLKLSSTTQGNKKGNRSLRAALRLGRQQGQRANRLLRAAQSSTNAVQGERRRQNKLWREGTGVLMPARHQLAALQNAAGLREFSFRTQVKFKARRMERRERMQAPEPLTVLTAWGRDCNKSLTPSTTICPQQSLAILSAVLTINSSLAPRYFLMKASLKHPPITSAQDIHFSDWRKPATWCQ